MEAVENQFKELDDKDKVNELLHLHGTVQFQRQMLSMVYSFIKNIKLDDIFKAYLNDEPIDLDELKSTINNIEHIENNTI